jgi:hypothetical protein
VLGRPSMAPYKQGGEGGGESTDLIAMNSPSPTKKAGRGIKGEERDSEEKGERVGEEARNRELEFQEGLLQREHRFAELEKELRMKGEEVEKLKEELKVRRESEDQMKQVLKEYERTISELIADKEKEKSKLEVCDEVISDMFDNAVA